MSDEVLNDVLTREFSFPYRCGYKTNTTVQKNAIGTVKQAFSHDTHDWATYTLQWAQLTEAQRVSLWEFIKAHGGNAENWLFKDTYGFGYEVARQSIGTGDAVEDEFQLIETYTSGAATQDCERWDIIAGSVSVWVATVLQTEGVHYTVDYTSSGLVTFVAPPAGAAAVEAAFSYYRRCRFVGDLGHMLSDYDNYDMPVAFEEEGV